MDGRPNRILRQPRSVGRLGRAAGVRDSSPLFPSDLKGQPGAARALTVAGRVLSGEAGAFVLSDAFDQLTARGSKVPPLAAGELVVVRGIWTGRVLQNAAVISRTPASTPTGQNEFARLVLCGVGPRLRARSRALQAIRKYFDDTGFVEVETPWAVPSPGVDRNIEAIRAGSGWLITSPELEMKRLIVGGIPRQYQLSRVARRGEAGTLHEEEFTLLEWYRSFSNFEQVLGDTEQLVASVARRVAGRRVLTLPDGRPIPVQPPFERISAREAFRKYAGISDVNQLADEDEARYFELLVGRVEPALARFDRPVFLFDYPISQAALSRPSPRDPRVAERFELYVGGVELCNGYGELTDPGEQRRRFMDERAQRRRERRPFYPINQRFLEALAEGMPPCAGNALGVDRLLMLATGARCIQDVIAFPRRRL